MFRAVLLSAMASSMILVMLNSAAAQAQSCTMDGKPVSYDDGSTTAGKTGMMICKKEGKLWRKFEYKKGKQSGYSYFVNDDGAEEFSTNDKGNKQGAEKKYSKNGQLILSGTYENGDYIGLLQQFYDNGKPKSSAWYEKGNSSPSMEIEYNKDGSMSSVRCGKQAFTDQDKEICGFNGTHTVTLVGYGGKTEKRTYKNGALSEFTEASKSGQVQAHAEIKDGLEHKKTFFDNGGLQTDTVYKGSLKVSEISYYMNGNHKSEIHYKDEAKRSTREVQEFSNSGKLSRKATEIYFNDEGYDGYKPIGSEEDYFESGALKKSTQYNDAGELNGEQKVYDEKGTLRELKAYEKDTLRHRKSFDENGKLKSDREYFADGSYKEVSH